MPTTSTFADGDILVSSALTQNALGQILQTLLCQVLNINPATDARAYSKVRLDWIQQPAFTQTDDVCSIRVEEKAGEYSETRDRANAVNNGVSVTQTDTFVRIWGITWGFHGPNSGDHARLLRSAMALDFTTDLLTASNLSLVSDFPAAVRSPELFEGLYWDRSDIKHTLYELVTETLIVPTVVSVELIGYTDTHTGEVFDITT